MADYANFPARKAASAKNGKLRAHRLLGIHRSLWHRAVESPLGHWEQELAFGNPPKFA